MNPFFSTFENTASSVWDAWKKVENTVDAAVGLPVVVPVSSSPTAAPVPASVASVVKEEVAEAPSAPVEAAVAPPLAKSVESVEPVASGGGGDHESQLLRLAARNAQLESELQALQTANTSSNAVSEFSARLGQVEARLRAMTNERDAARRELETVRKEADSRVDSATRELRESYAVLQREVETARKAESAVRSEGEELSKKIGKLELVLKNVRGQLTEKTAALEAESRRAADAEGKLAEASKEIQGLKEQLTKWEGTTRIGARAAEELQELKHVDSELKRKLGESQQALETAWSDLAALRKEMAQKITEATEIVR